ncbi:hypothetical protein QQF64_015548 [Cirrhinus molitorella]|uniref:C-type lectin domain-containing protein n=1 Tax=Cirrhinus molitorella TaxID=172907 RepID=A0ABR3NV90_9TELE
MDGTLYVVLLLSGVLRITSGVYKKYTYINVRMSWPEAQSYCRAKHTDLAFVETMDDANRLINIVDAGYSGSVWIGLKRGTQKRWGWSYRENTLAQYNAWNGGEPNSQNDCAYLAYGVWHTHKCSRALYFVCYNESTGYIKVELWKNWTDAQSYCRKYHADLATIRNSEDQNQIKSIVPSTSWVWIGLFQDSWEWSDKWSNFFRHWAVGQPSQSLGSDECVGMSTANSGKWIHESCYLQRPFICHGWPKSPFRTYQYMNESMTWLDAQSYCRARFTDLATADSINDVNRLIKTNSRYSGSVWIGLHAGTEQRWVWSLGEGTISNYSMWSAGEPNGDGQCVRSFNGSWYDESCSTVLPFVCFNDSTGFIITETAMTWRDAQSYCRQHHTDLASISSPEQLNLLSNESSLWIGLFLDSWQWSDQTNLSFRHWKADQPSLISGSGDCVGMSINNSGKWVQYSCDQRQPFICYGDDKLIRKQIVRLKLSCDGKCTLNDPSLQTAFLNKISEKLKSMGVESDKMSWIQGEGEEVFHLESKPKANSNNHCNSQ